MTNEEEVIKHLILLKESAVKSHNDTGIINVKLDSFNFVMDMAIRALEYDDAKYHEDHGEVIVDKAVWEDAERALQEPCEDAISRRAVLDLLEDTNNGWIINEVLQLPSVKPQERTGYRIFEGNQLFSCSSCGRIYTQKAFEYLKLYKDDPDFPNYCPNCGAKMAESEERSDKE